MMDFISTMVEAFVILVAIPAVMCTIAVLTVLFVS